MAITEEEYKKEEKILSKVRKLLKETLEDLGGDVFQDEEDLTEFKKMLWENASSFDKGEMSQVMAATSQEAERVLQKRQYFKRLNQIKNKPLLFSKGLRILSRTFWFCFFFFILDYLIKNEESVFMNITAAARLTTNAIIKMMSLKIFFIILHH